SFCYNDPEVLLMRRQYKNFRCRDSAPLLRVAQHPGPGNSITDTKRVAHPFQFRLPPHLIGSYYQEVPVRIPRQYIVESLHKQVASLLGMNASDKYRQAFALQIRILTE